MSKYVKYTYVSTQNFVGIRSSKLFEVKSGHKKSLEVKQGSNPSIKRQIGPVGRNISNIHTFRLRILSEIDIQNYSRSYQVIKSHQRSNLSKTCQKRVKTGCLIQLYALFNSKQSFTKRGRMNLNSRPNSESKHMYIAYNWITQPVLTLF